jgi:hypothetical protein
MGSSLNELLKAIAELATTPAPGPRIETMDSSPSSWVPVATNDERGNFCGEQPTCVTMIILLLELARPDA